MATNEQTQDLNAAQPSPDADQDTEHEENVKPDEADGLAHKKPEDLTPEELRLMADTMPGEGPGD